MLTLKSVCVEDARKKAACRACGAEIPEGVRHVVVIRHGKTRAGRAYDRKEALCVPCGAKTMTAEMEAYNRTIKEFLLDLSKEVVQAEGATP